MISMTVHLERPRGRPRLRCTYIRRDIKANGMDEKDVLGRGNGAERFSMLPVEDVAC